MRDLEQMKLGSEKRMYVEKVFRRAKASITQV